MDILPKERESQSYYHICILQNQPSTLEIFVYKIDDLNKFAFCWLVSDDDDGDDYSDDGFSMKMIFLRLKLSQKILLK